MSEEKLSSEQVPSKFAEWLLAMGCPPEDVPPLDKISEMCRGQYYMVWRSLMEHVGPKDTILAKRLQVFNNDIVKCKKKNVFNESDVNMPKEFSLWRQLTELKEQVADAEARVTEEREKLNTLLNKVSSKLAHRILSKRRLVDAQRRSWLLQQVASELRERKVNLQETKTIADSLCCLDDSQDVESKLDKCLLALSRPSSATSRGGSLLSVASPDASSTIASTNDENDTEELVSSLVKCRGDVVFKQLYERRAGLCAMVASHPDNTNKDKDRMSAQSVLAHTLGLHSTLALGALRNRAHTSLTRKRMAIAFNDLSKVLSGPACELLVLRCEHAHGSARAQALRTLLDELDARGGVFAAAGGEHKGSNADVHHVDKSILSKREELKRLITSAAVVERKTQNAKKGLLALFNSLHTDERTEVASQMSTASPQASIASLRQFYEERRERRHKKMELSINFDVSDSCSYTEQEDNGSPKFADELRMYLKKFNLEKNRKLVLESGEKIWSFETMQSSVELLYAKWLSDDVTTSILCPSVSLAHNLARLAQEAAARAELEAVLRLLEGGKRHELALDISSTIDEEEKTLDRIKKRLNENIQNLQKAERTLQLGTDNLNIWAGNTLKQYISENRTVDGRNYRKYEKIFLECLKM